MSLAKALEKGLPEAAAHPLLVLLDLLVSLLRNTVACHGRQQVQPRAGAATAQRQQSTLLTWKGVFLRWTLKENESLPMITRPQARAACAERPAASSQRGSCRVVVPLQ